MPYDSMSSLVTDVGLFSPDHVANQYQGYPAQNGYSFDSGLAVMPVAGPPTTNGQPTGCRLVRLHAPVMTRNFPWQVSREGTKPLLPDPAPQNSNEVLLGWNIAPQPPALDAVGQVHTYQASGEYSYVLVQPLTVPGTLRMGATPYDITDANTNVYNSGDFTQKLQ